MVDIEGVGMYFQVYYAHIFIISKHLTLYRKHV